MRAADSSAGSTSSGHDPYHINRGAHSLCLVKEDRYEADALLVGIWAHIPLIELLKGFPNWVLGTL